MKDPFGETEGEIDFLRQHLTMVEIAEGYAYEKILNGGYQFDSAIAWGEKLGITRRTMIRGIVLARRKINRNIQILIDFIED